MRIAQIIDTLEIGGAERMAVNYANAVQERLGFSALITSRRDGPLLAQVGEKVNRFSMKRSRTLDIAALRRLRRFCVVHRITHLQAHSSSYFTAVMLKLMLMRIKIIWHDHNGLSDLIGGQKFAVLKRLSRFFSGIIVVNEKLRVWAIRELNCSKVIYFPNYIQPSEVAGGATDVKGIDGKRILCLANLRDQKNHFFLLDIASNLKQSHPDWTFHLVGKDFEDDYSARLRTAVSDKNLENHVFLYGSRDDAAAFIGKSEICILTSKSEGLPVALLEYGYYNKPVVVTNVGELPQLIRDGENGFLSDKADVAGFHEKLELLIDQPELRSRLGNSLKELVDRDHTEAAVIDTFISWVAEL